MISFNEGQQRVLKAATDWYHNSSEQIFQFAGNPGTGKSLILNEIIHRLGLSIIDVAPMSYTGASSINMRIKGLSNAKTIHSWLYTPTLVPVLDSEGNEIIDTYFNKPKMTVQFIPKDLSGIKLMVIDEGGTVPYYMKNDIEAHGVKIIVAGDLDQLEPVGDKPAYLYRGKVHVLDQIMRQEEDSAIIYLSQRAKKGLPIHTGLYGNDVLVITEDEATPCMFLNSGVILCGKNNTRDKLTNYIRYNLLKKTTNTPGCNELLICRKNNWALEAGGINLTNGLTGTVLNQPDPSGFDGKTFRIDFQPLLTNIPFIDIPVDYEYFISSHDQKEAMKLYNARYSVGDKFEFGYAQTVHLAQGSQWPCGMYYEEYLHPDTNNRLNYTALSRFSKQCIYVKQKRKFY